MLSIIKECKLKTKSKKLFRLAALYVAAFSISTPAVMYFSTGEVTLNLFVEGFWVIGLLQAAVFTFVVDCSSSDLGSLSQWQIGNDWDFEKRSRQRDPFYAHEVGNIWHGTHLDSSSEEYWK